MSVNLEELLQSDAYKNIQNVKFGNKRTNIDLIQKISNEVQEDMEVILQKRADALNSDGPIVEMEAFSDDEFAGIDGEAVDAHTFQSLGEKFRDIAIEPFSLIGKFNDYIKDSNKPKFINPDNIMETSTLLTTEPEEMNMVGNFEDNREPIGGIAPISSTFSPFGSVKPKTLTKCKTCDWEGSKTTYYSKHKKDCETRIEEDKIVRQMAEEEEKKQVVEAEKKQMTEQKEKELKEACQVTMSNICVTLPNGDKVSIDNMTVSGSTRVVISSSGISFE